MPPRPKIQIPVWRACEYCRINRRKCTHKYAVLLARKIDGPDATPQPLQDKSLIAYAADPSFTRKVRKRNVSLARSDVGIEEDKIKREDEGRASNPPRVHDSRSTSNDRFAPLLHPPSPQPPRVYPPSHCSEIVAHPSAERDEKPTYYINSRGSSSHIENLSIPSSQYPPIRPATERKYSPAIPTIQQHHYRAAAYHQQQVLTPAPSRASPSPSVHYRKNTKYGSDPHSRWSNPAKASASRFSGPKMVTPLTATRR